MAAEALVHKYIFRPVAELLPPKLEDLTDDESEEDASEDETDTKPKPNVIDDRDPNFTFNDLHDLESIWWVLVWILFFKDDCVRNPQLRLAPTRQRRMESLFSRGRNYAPRNELLTGITDLSNPNVTALPRYFKPAISMLVAASRLLVNAYHQAELNVPNINVDAFKIHATFVEYLSSPLIRAKIKSIQLVPVKIVQEESVDAQAGLKRKPMMTDNSSASASKKIR